MSEDRSLDEFAAAGDDEGRDETSERRDTTGEAEPEDVGGEVPDADAVEEAPPIDASAEGTTDADPAVSTATWTTDGAACDRCGERVARRWRDDDALVCAACKEW